MYVYVNMPYTQATDDSKEETIIEVTSEGCTFSNFGKEKTVYVPRWIWQLIITT